MAANDPWSWTVDELVAEVCHSNALFQAAGYALNTPDLQALESQLRSQCVTGKIFLTVINSRTVVVENDLKIAHLSQRLALMTVVELLRHRSCTYKQYAATTGVESLDINNIQPSLSERPAGSSADVASVDNAGRKRRKVTYITTVPLSSTLHHNPKVPLASATGSSEQASADTDEFSHLLRWQNAAYDEELDLAAEEDLEDDEQYSLGDAAEEDPREIPDDDDRAVPGPSSRPRLTTDQITKIINEHIESYASSWVVNRGVTRGEEVQYDVDAMWEEAEASGRRQELAQKYETDHAYYSQRLYRICDEIVAYAGNSADAIRRQCGNLDVTIDSMELADWLRGIYELEPVDDSEDSGSEDDSVPHDGPTIQPITATHRPRPSTEVIDLDSPSESSDIEEDNASPFDHPAAAVAQTVGDRVETPIRFYTPDSIIGDNVEPATPDLPTQPVTERLVPSRTSMDHRDEPEHASIATVRRWRWSDLIEHQDRKRVVSKAILEMGTGDRGLIRSRIRDVGKAYLVKEIGACVHMLHMGKTRIPGVLQRDMGKVHTFTNLFLSWWFCSNCIKQQPGASKKDLEELADHMNGGSAETGTFYDYVYTVMETTFSPEALQHADRPSEAEIIEISDDDD